MNLRLMILVWILCFTSVQAQRLDVNGWQGNKNSFAQVYGFFSVGSSDFSMRFLSQSLFSETVSNDQVQEQFDLLNPGLNRLGGDYESAFRLKLGLFEKGALLLKIGDYAHTNLTVDKNLFGLFYRGNAPYAGDSLFFNPSNGTLQRYQQVGVGYSSAMKDGSEFFVMLSAINAQAMFNAALYRGALYTSSFGDTVYADAFFSGVATDGGFSNGGGAAVSLGIATKAVFFNSDWTANMSIENLGMVQYNNQTSQFGLDTNLTYVGFELSDFDSGFENEIQSQIEDSLIAGFNDVEYTRWTNALLPGYAQLSLIKDVEKGLALGFGGTYRWQSEFNAYAWGQAGYSFGNGLSLLGEAGYGGYTGIQLGVSAKYETETIGVHARLSSVEGLLQPKSQLGLTAFLGINYQFEL